MIVDPILLLAFIPVGLALNVTPGPDMMFCLAQGLRGARVVAGPPLPVLRWAAWCMSCWLGLGWARWSLHCREPLM